MGRRRTHPKKRKKPASWYAKRGLRKVVYASGHEGWTHKNEILDAPLPVCDWCANHPGLKRVRVFSEETLLCPACEYRLRMYDLGDYDRSHPGHTANLVRMWPEETRTRFTPHGVDALQAGILREHLGTRGDAFMERQPGRLGHRIECGFSPAEPAETVYYRNRDRSHVRDPQRYRKAKTHRHSGESIRLNTANPRRTTTMNAHTMKDTLTETARRLGVVASQVQGDATFSCDAYLRDCIETLEAVLRSNRANRACINTLGAQDVVNALDGLRRTR